MHPYPSASSSSSSPSSSHRHQAIFDEFESYPFSDDPDFTAGLPTVISAIRGTKRSAAQIDEMIGRAQWFYFTRLRGLQIPWEVYAQHTLRAPLPPSPAGGSTPLQPVPTNPLAAINQISESRRMMMSDDSQGEAAEGSGSGGMSFAMLSRLISEGRAGEVPVQYIPEGINVSLARCLLSSLFSVLCIVFSLLLSPVYFLLLSYLFVLLLIFYLFSCLLFSFLLQSSLASRDK
ncbi:hypothetical protein BCR39DRAFT_253813 [Naematelia encephala]|uniref:PEX14-like helix-turn-helix domain-containing protein n=1 Tax=Naematelia encephala TaxID=71784 RepID=A0A1Y2AVN0_9TREE|nr:hypothetical protein BCR39DRAFT_253813 [Naematelia encephala]